MSDQERHMLNVQVDIETNELFKYLKDKRKAGAMYEAVRDFILEHLPENERIEAEQRVQARREYMKMRGKS